MRNLSLSTITRAQIHRIAILGLGVEKHHYIDHFGPNITQDGMSLIPLNTRCDQVTK